MKQKEDLFKLIEAMSKSEKRYFTLDAKKSGRRSSNYLELFQAINQMDDYDEQKLQKKFGKNLPSDKSYLYESILRSMRDYRSSKSRAARIKEMILDARYLYERGLYPQSEERFKQAKELAKELDDQLSLLEISREQLNYTWVTKPKSYGTIINQLLEEKDHFIENINEELHYLSLSYKIQMAKNSISPEAQAEEIATQFPSASNTEDFYPDSAHAQRRYLQSLALFNNLLTEDVEKANTYYSKMVAWWDDYPSIKEEEYVRYISDVFNLFNVAYTQKNYAQFEQLLTKLENEKPTNYHDQRLLFKQLTNYKLLYYINLGVEDGHEELIEQVSQGMNAYKLNPVSQLIIAFNLTLLLFILDKHSICLEWCEKISKHYNRKVNNEHFRLATLLINLLCSYEEDEIEKVDSAIRSLQRHTKQSDYKGIFFKETGQLIRKLSYSAAKKHPDLFLLFEQKITQLRQGGETPPMRMDELALNWIKSKQRKVPLRKILKVQAT